MGKGETGQVRVDGQKPHKGTPAEDVPQPGETGETGEGAAGHGETAADRTGGDRGEAPESRPATEDGQLHGAPQAPEEDTEHSMGAVQGHNTPAGRRDQTTALDD